MNASSIDPMLYLVLFIISGGVVLLANALHYAIEESTIINFRLRLSLLLLATLVIPAYCFITFDNWHYTGFTFLGKPYLIDQNHYYALLALFALATTLRFYRFADYEDLVFLILIAVYLLRFLVGVGNPAHVFFWVFFAFMLYYGVFVIWHWTRQWGEIIFLGACYTALVWALLWFWVDNLRASGYLMTYMSYIFMATLWVRYFWNLEFKRRQRCKTCGGWGKLGIKEKHFFWWAAGNKESSSSVPCQKCEGKGWTYRYPDLFHITK